MLRLEIIDDDSGRGVQSYADGIEAAAEAEVARINSELALECERTLRNRTLTLWPIRTGYSRDRWRGEDVAGKDYIEIVNTADYAQPVNDIATYPQGRPNPNFRAAQRTLEKWWDRILTRAVARAAKSRPGRRS